MAVESRFVVIRQGVEVETFMDKKAADEYDKMLDMADNLSEMFEQAPVELSESIREELSVYLAQNRDDVLVALQAKKAKATNTKAVVSSPKKTKAEVADEVVEADSVNTTEKVKKAKSPSAKASSKTKPVVA
ncbi:YebG family protein [Colwellia sp. PAMC 21821]|uniref:YebG family protein n=1 Tax=Colwellia sp. PAMC 21821 TaxID=1816219 RepID=UPI0009C1168C|nr:YebG family protein [Colwellia sp. PAMC 21821]